MYLQKPSFPIGTYRDKWVEALSTASLFIPRSHPLSCHQVVSRNVPFKTPTEATCFQGSNVLNLLEIVSTKPRFRTRTIATCIS